MRGPLVDSCGPPQRARTEALERGALVDIRLAHNQLVGDELVVGRAYVDEGPTLKRYRPRALGRATRIRKRTSHMTITLTTTEDGR